MQGGVQSVNSGCTSQSSSQLLIRSETRLYDHTVSSRHVTVVITWASVDCAFFAPDENVSIWADVSEVITVLKNLLHNS